MGRKRKALRRHRHRPRAIARRGPPGTAPGSLSIPEDALPPEISLFRYGPDAFEEKAVASVAELQQAMTTDQPVTWVNVNGLGDTAVIQQIGELFALHPLALEDVVHTHQRPKIDHYEGTAFVTLKQMTLGDRLDTEQVSLFLGDRFVITFQERKGDCLDPIRERIRRDAGRVRRSGADYLAYAILDAITDHYFPVLERFGERIEELEDTVFTSPIPDTVAAAHAARRDLLSVRRAIWPMRDMFSTMLREDLPLITAETRVYLRDCYDHAIQLVDITETYRELTTGLMDVYLSTVSNRMNEVMKLLTIIATIFIPLSFVTGLYGMNFDPSASSWNMPELGWRYGYPAALGVMLVVAVGLLLFFRRRGWLGSDGTSPPSNAAGRADSH